MAFIQLAFQFKLLGGAMFLFGLLIVFGNHWIGGSLLAAGTAFLVTGYGISSYKPWGWYAGAILVLPLLILSIVLAGLFGIVRGHFALIAVLVILPPYCYYTAWTLFSKGGRQRYAETVAAIQSAKENPDSMAGRMWRRR